MKYIIAFRRNDRLGLEEYDGGTTIAEARKEAAFFRANLPADTEIRICKPFRNGLALSAVEYYK